MKLITYVMLILGLFITAVYAQEVPTSLIVYDPTDEIFPNPERGFSAYRSSKLNVSFIQDLRSQNVTVIQRIYTIPQFNNSALSQSFLDLVDSDLNTAREGGAKLVLRFSYTNDQEGADAPLDTILMQIGQLAPLFQKHYDVINYIEAGFIGAWGEWYYSSHGLNNTTARRAVLYKELSVLPTDRAVVIRTPGYKRAIFNYTEALIPDSAFSGSYRARTGAHNDCFLASATDYGTYTNIEADKTYLNLDNRYVPQGGETCNPSAYSGCDNALIDLARMRWSVLNKDYHSTVLNGWITNGCMDEIKRRLGYRFSLLQASLTDSVKPGGECNLDFDIINSGFASPYNPRNLEIILRNEATKQKYFVITDDDPRTWMAGDTAQVTITAGIPPDIPEGSYQALIHLSDPVLALHGRPEYAIRLANQDVWEDSTGYNSLRHSIIIDADAVGDPYSGDLIFQPIDDHPTGVIDKPVNQPDTFRLKGNYPNPFNGTTLIQFDLDKSADVSIDIISISGKLINNLIHKRYQAGSYRVTWEPGDLSSGTYIYRLTVNGISQSGKALYLK